MSSPPGIEHEENGNESRLIEQRKIQLREISERRNVLVLEMFMMLRQREDMGASCSVIPNSIEMDDELEVLLDTYDLEKLHEPGYVGHLSEGELYALVEPHVEVTSPKLLPSRSDSRKPPLLKRLTLHDPIDDDEPDELDLLSSPRKRARTKSPGVNNHYVKGASSGSSSSRQGSTGSVVSERHVEMMKSEPVELQSIPVPREHEHGSESRRHSLDRLPETTPMSGVGSPRVEEEPAATLSEPNEDLPQGSSSVSEHTPLVPPAPAPAPASSFVEIPPQSQLDSPDVPVSVVHPSVPVVHPVEVPTPMEVDQPAQPELPPRSTASPIPPAPVTPTRSEPASQFTAPSAIQVPSISQIAGSLVPTPTHPTTSQGDDESPSTPKSTTTTALQNLPINPALLTMAVESELRSVTSTEPEFMFEGVTASSFTCAHPPQSTSKLSSSSSFFSSSSQQKIKLQFDPQYTLPPLRSLPLEFKPKKTSSKRKKKEKEKSFDGGYNNTVKKGGDDWTPMSFTEWSALIHTNPVWKRTSKATKCLMSHDWSLALTEMKLWRAFDRIEALKDYGKWSGRQPKKHRQLMNKTHWDHLLDEMKWIRIDFREERKWKLALAYNLSTAVLEWHAAGTTQVRIEMGVIARWQRPGLEDAHDNITFENADASLPLPLPLPLPTSSSTHRMDVDQTPKTPSPPLEEIQTNSNSLGIDYGSDDDDNDDDDDDDDDEDEEKQSAVDATEIAALVSEHFDSRESRVDELVDPVMMKEFELKKDVDESVLQKMVVDGEEEDGGEEEGGTNVNTAAAAAANPGFTPQEALKTSSGDPLLSGQATEVIMSGEHSQVGSDNSPTLSNKPTGQGLSTTPATATATSKNPCTSIRDAILFGDDDDDSLFISLDQFKNLNISSGPDIDTLPPPPPPDFSAIFPELLTYTLIDPTPPPTDTTKRSKDKKVHADDPRKRVDDLSYSKMYPASRFMFYKPTLLGPLQPSKRWDNNNGWINWDDSVPVFPIENPAIMADVSSEMFDPKVSHQLHAAAAIHNMDKVPTRVDKDKSRIGPPPVWTDPDDAILKSVIDRFPGTYNWTLIAEFFNATRNSMSTDKRSSRDVFERFKEKWQSEIKSKYGMPSTTTVTQIGDAQQGQGQANAQASSFSGSLAASQMTTRKRLASLSSGTPTLLESSGEGRRRRRHLQIDMSMKKATKKRQDYLQKSLVSQRKVGNVHDTHTQFSRMKQYSPPELSRMKSDREREVAEAANRKRQEALTAASAARLSQGQVPQGGQPTQVPPGQQPQQPGVPGGSPQQQQQQQQMVSSTNGVHTSPPLQAAVPPSGAGAAAAIQATSPGQQAVRQQPQMIVAGQPRGPSPTDMGAVATQMSRTPSQNSNPRQTPVQNGMQHGSPPHQFAIPANPSHSPPLAHLHGSPPRQVMTAANHLQIPSAQGQGGVATNPNARTVYNNANMMAHHLTLTHATAQNPQAGSPMNANQVAALLAQQSHSQHLQPSQAQNMQTQPYSNYQWTPEQVQALRHYQAQTQLFAAQHQAQQQPPQQQQPQQPPQ